MLLSVKQQLFSFLLFYLSIHYCNAGEQNLKPKTSEFHEPCLLLLEQEKGPEITCYTLIQNTEQHVVEASQLTSNGTMTYDCHEINRHGRRIVVPARLCRQVSNPSKVLSVIHHKGYRPLPFNPKIGYKREEGYYELQLFLFSLYYSLSNAIELGVHIKELYEHASEVRALNSFSAYKQVLTVFEAIWLPYEIGRHFMHMININMDVESSDLSATIEMLSSAYEIPRSFYKMLSSIKDLISANSLSGLVAKGPEVFTYTTHGVNIYVTSRMAIDSNLYPIRLIRRYIIIPLWGSSESSEEVIEAKEE